ncbi:MAG: UxaA family hydrolase, partial [Planctomycetota bacterium]
MSSKVVDVIYLNAQDNICVAARPLAGGSLIEAGGSQIKVETPVPMGHKIAIKPIAKDEPVRKYGQIIGFASEPIKAGSWVHSHNVVIGEFTRDYASATETPPPPTP